MGEKKLLLTELEKDRIYKKWCMGYTLKELAAENYVSISTIHKAIHNRPLLPFEGEWQNSPTERRKRSNGVFIEDDQKVALSGEKGCCNMALGERVICPVCGKTFTKTREHLKVCSAECGEIRRKELRDARKELKKQFPNYKPPKRADDYRYGKPLSENKPIDYGKLDRTLARLKEQGLDYTEEQKKQTIERYARITL